MAEQIGIIDMAVMGENMVLNLTDHAASALDGQGRAAARAILDKLAPDLASGGRGE